MPNFPKRFRPQCPNPSSPEPGVGKILLSATESTMARPPDTLEVPVTHWKILDRGAVCRCLNPLSAIAPASPAGIDHSRPAARIRGRNSAINFANASSESC